MARCAKGAQRKRPQIRLQSVLLAITSLPSDPWSRGGDQLTPTSHLTGGVQIPLVRRHHVLLELAIDPLPYRFV